jgi:nitrogen fixation protein NifU and related proteins
MTVSKSYNALLLDHSKNPRNFGRLDNPDLSHEESNSLCGDRIKVDIKVHNNRISNIRFEGRGCAISIAAASILSEMVKGRSIEECSKFTDNQMIEALEAPIKKPRMNCALLGLKAFKKLLTKA